MPSLTTLPPMGTNHDIKGLPLDQKHKDLLTAGTHCRCRWKQITSAGTAGAAKLIPVGAAGTANLHLPELPAPLKKNIYPPGLPALLTYICRNCRHR